MSPEAMTASNLEPEIFVIRPRAGWARLGLAELWRYRELVGFLTWRNVLVRYKQTGLGVGWALIQPVLLMTVFTVISKIGKTPTNGVPRPIFMYAALVPWLFFATSMGQSANSLVGNANLLSKVYFPRLALPLATVFAAFVDLIISSLLLIALMVWFGTYPRPIAAIAVVGLLLLDVACALGVGLWLSALNVAYRDVQYIVPFITQVWLFSTVFYPLSQLSQPWRTLVGLNPMAGVIEGFRWALIGAHRSPGWMVAVSAGVALLILSSGLVYFRHAEKTFADIV